MTEETGDKAEEPAQQQRSQADLERIADKFSLSVVIPIYNEIKTLDQVVRRVQEVGMQTEIILVDDGSTDGSRELVDELAKEAGIRAFKHARNMGKGAALKTGFENATGNLVIIQDADLEYDPEDYLLLVRPFFEAEADVVYGSRYLVGRYTRVHPYYHYCANQFLTWFSNLFTGLKLTDMETCYKVFRREVVQNLVIKSKRFTVEPEITARLAKMNLRIFEVPISYLGRDHAHGKKIGWLDGIAALLAIIRYRFGG